MSIAANSQLLNLSEDLEPITSQKDACLTKLGSELVYTQDINGYYLTFYWQQSDYLEITSQVIIGDWNRDGTFAPIDKESYLQRLQRILSSSIPERCQCTFSYGQYLLELELTISPIMPSLGHDTTKVLVMGRLLQVNFQNKQVQLPPKIPTELSLTLRQERHQKILNQITRSIRRTLDLDLIWQQTVDSLGEALKVKRCFICPYHISDSKVQVIAEYHQPSVNSILGLKIDIAPKTAFGQAIVTGEPIISQVSKDSYFQEQKILVVATCYQDQANGLIALSLPDECHELTTEELELAKEAADQLGTAIAHATLYKELEAARQNAEEATRRKSEFLANVTHELRTPINGIIGFLKLIIDGMADDPEEQAQFLEEAHKSSLYLLDIINDILDIPRIEAGKMELELRSITLDEIFSDVENFMRLQAEEKNLSFRTKMPDTCDEIMIYGDYQRLKQVMLNLLSNAIKFTHEGGITVSADVVNKKVKFQDEQFPGMVRVRVADTGIGVSLDKQDKLFQSFYQVDGSRTRQYGGTGLGLAISQTLVEAMGGEMHFYSLGEGLGSTVTFTVPLYQQPVMVSATENEGSALSREWGSGGEGERGSII